MLFSSYSSILITKKIFNLTMLQEFQTACSLYYTVAYSIRTWNCMIRLGIKIAQCSQWTLIRLLGCIQWSDSLCTFQMTPIRRVCREKFYSCLWLKGLYSWFLIISLKGCGFEPCTGYDGENSSLLFDGSFTWSLVNQSAGSLKMASSEVDINIYKEE